MARFRSTQNSALTNGNVRQYNISRFNILIAALLTVINVITLISAEGGSYFLFSLTLPYFFVEYAMALCGKFPPEYYEGSMSDYEFLPDSLYTVALIVCFAAIAVVIATFFLSAKMRGGFLIAALAIISLDTIAMLYLYFGFYLEAIVEIIFHAYFIVSLSMGIRAYFKLKSMPPVILNELPEGEGGQGFKLLPTDLGGTGAIIYAELAGARIAYRREGSKYFLDVNGSPAAELKAFSSASHALSANVQGMTLCVGFDGYYSYVSISGNTVYMISKYRKIEKAESGTYEA